MTASSIRAAASESGLSVYRIGLPAMLLVVIVAGVLAAKFVPVLDKWPADFVIPARDWVTAAFAWFAVVAKAGHACHILGARPAACLRRGTPLPRLARLRMASASLGFDRDRNRNPRALGWRPTTSALLRQLPPSILQSSAYGPTAMQTLGDRRGDGAGCRRDWPSLRHMGNAQRPGGARLERNLRRYAGNAAHGLSRDRSSCSSASGKFRQCWRR